MEKENISTMIEPKAGELDATDIKILTCLQDNSRLTTKELAAKVHLSTTPVFERQKRLEREGYMFYSVQDLLEGLFVHVGMNRLEAMEKKDIKAMVEATKDGSLVKRLQAEVNELKATIDEQRKEIRSLKRKMKE